MWGIEGTSRAVFDELAAWDAAPGRLGPVAHRVFFPEQGFPWGFPWVFTVVNILINC
jgi:hypothetical protein